MGSDSRYDMIIGAIGLVVVIVAFAIDRVIGTRVAGVMLAGAGVLAIRSRSIPYGIEGEPPMGYIKGRWAVVVGAVVVSLGIFIVWNARELAEHM